MIVDATDMGLNPGTSRLIDPDDIADMFMMTTHNMPLNYLVDQIKEDVGECCFGHSAGHRRILLPDDTPVKSRGGNGLFTACGVGWKGWV